MLSDAISNFAISSHDDISDGLNLVNREITGLFAADTGVALEYGLVFGCKTIELLLSDILAHPDRRGSGDD